MNFIKAETVEDSMALPVAQSKIYYLECSSNLPRRKLKSIIILKFLRLFYHHPQFQVQVRMIDIRIVVANENRRTK